MERHIEGAYHRIARRDSALIRSQFRPKLRYRNPARGMGVQRAKKTQGGFGPPSFVHALSPELV